MNLRKFSFFILFFLVFLNPRSSVNAQEEFFTKYVVTYQAREDEQLEVVQQIDITNKLSGLYASKYTVSFPNKGINNIRAYDASGDLPYFVTGDGERTTVTVDFPSPVVGLGKNFRFYLKYELPDLVFKNGQIWEVFLPKLNNIPDINEYQAVLVVPKSFGLPAYISPSPAESQEEEKNYRYTFSYNQLLGQAVRAAFGNFQIFDFVLDYHLENLKKEADEEEIALPADNAWQLVSFSRIDPLPLDVEVDNDGNWLAKYRLRPGERLNVSVAGKVKIFSDPNKSFFLNRPKNLDKMTKTDKYWETDDPLIAAKAKELSTPRAIYQFVVDYLTYNYDKVRDKTGRLGAAKAIRNPKNAICTEFTDLFIAIARAAGIPAREINGFAYTSDVRLKPLSLISDILHAWPEYFDKEKSLWVAVDPTWEKTTGGIDYFQKLDLSHFAFVIHGENSQKPYPAGSYRVSGSYGKDVQVVFGKYEQEPIPKISIDFDLPSTVIPGLSPKGNIIIKNLSGQAFYNLPLFFETEGLHFATPVSNKITVLPPYAVENIAVTLVSNQIISFSQGKIVATANNQQFIYKANIGLSFNQPLLIAGLGIFLTGSLTIFVVKIKMWSKA